MAKYRVFEKDLITNNWVDKDWAEGSGQQDCLRKIAIPGNTYFVVPESSFHPVTMATVEVVRWEFDADGGSQEVIEAQPEKGAVGP